MSSSDDDSQQRFALGFLFALIALVVATVVGVVVFKRGIAHAPTAPKAGVVQAVEAAAPGVAVVEEASVVVEGGVVKFYFAVGKADLATGAKQALADVIKGVLQGKKAVVSGFHDATGNLAVNQELAKQRAFAVRDALLSLGITEEGIELKKPEQTLADGSDAEARRVEVTLAP